MVSPALFGPTRSRRAHTFGVLAAIYLCSVGSGCGDDDKDATAHEPADDGGTRPPISMMDASTSMGLDAQTPTNGDAARANPDGAVEPPDESAALYDPNAILDLKIVLAAADWDKLRGEGRNLNQVFSGCVDPAFEYTKMHARLEVAGETFADVAVRKKGFLGSISARKPSLRIELDEYVSGQALLGSKTLVLNNSLTDPSYIHQCMAYQAFRATGIAAPRCSFAHVTVNGQDLGLFVNIEPIKKPFVRRAFGSDSGNLYEGSAPADFRADMLVNFEKKTNTMDPAKPEIEALAALLLKTDDELLAGLDALLDVDQFLRFWAVETMLAFWDSYSSDLNNFYLYADPATNKLNFIPWGPDDAYTRAPVLLARPPGTPQSVYATARLSRRLYAIPAMQARYREALRSELTQHWNESALLAEVDRLSALLGTVPKSSWLDAQRAFITTRKAELLAELDAPAPVWPLPEKQVNACNAMAIAPLALTFDTTWGAAAMPTPSLGNTITVGGVPLPSLTVLGSADPSSRELSLPLDQITLTSVRPDGSLLIVQFAVGEAPLVASTVPLHGFESFGVVLAGADPTSLALVGFVGEGALALSAGSDMAGGRVAGRFDGKMVFVAPLPPLKLPLTAAPTK